MPGSDTWLRYQMPGSNAWFRCQIPSSDAWLRYQMPGSDAWLRCQMPGSDAWFRYQMPQIPRGIKGIKVNISPLNISSVTRNLRSKILRFREGLKLKGLDLIIKSK
jgi:hypothetical protein